MGILGGGIAERACRQDSDIVYSSGTNKQKTLQNWFCFASTAPITTATAYDPVILVALSVN